MDEFEKLIKRRSAHERFLRIRGFNWHRLRLVDDVNPRSKKRFDHPPVPSALPTQLEWLLGCAIAALLAGAYLWWTGEIHLAWEWLMANR